MSCCKCECECGLHDKDERKKYDWKMDKLIDEKLFPPPLKYQLSEKLMKALLFDGPKPMINGLSIRLKDCSTHHATIEVSLVDAGGAALMFAPDVTVTKHNSLTLFDIKKMFEVKVTQ